MLKDINFVNLNYKTNLIFKDGSGEDLRSEIARSTGFPAQYLEIQKDDSDGEEIKGQSEENEEVRVMIRWKEDNHEETEVLIEQNIKDMFPFSIASPEWTHPYLNQFYIIEDCHEVLRTLNSDEKMPYK